jgi:hypothetical protein
LNSLASSRAYEVTLTSGSVSVTKSFTTLAQETQQIPGATVSGTIEVEEDVPGSGTITVRLDLGSLPIMSQTAIWNSTGENYTYTFADVPDGYYNVVVLSGEQIVTQGVEVKNGEIIGAVPPMYVKNKIGNESTVVEVKSDAPEIAQTTSAAGLPELFEQPVEDPTDGVTAADSAAVTAGGTVEIKLVVDKLPDTASEQAAEQQIRNDTNTSKVIQTLIDLSVLKTVYQPDGTTDPPTNLVTLQNLIAVTIEVPRNMANRTDSLAVYRIHEGVTDVITTTANADGEYFELSADRLYITLHIKKFSVYALAANPPSSDDDDSPAVPPAQSVTTDCCGCGIPGCVCAMPYTDVPEGAWYKMDACFAYCRGLMSGTSDTAFSPNATTTRGMIATILYALEEKPSAAGLANPFTDLTAAWYKNAVIWAAEHEIVAGYGGGLYGPEDAITREQLAQILYRYAAFKGYDVTAAADLTRYADAGDISAYAQGAIKWANAEGLMSGRSATTLAPKGAATRAEVATMLHQFVENAVNGKES